MQRAISLARLAMGTTSPNPSVGAVLVKDGVVVGEGYTLPPGQRHAEIGALQQAGEAARGAILYTTLEPCCHFGRTPPCTRAVIAAGVKEVHFALIDPNPRVRNGGRAELEAAGIAVVAGEEAGPAAELYEGFAKHITTGLPFVSAKFAMSLDGKIAARTGDSKWVTGPDARSLVQQMRLETDAVMVGINTVLADDPQLTVRIPVAGPQNGK
ncbi:MAG: bifunctional diaminohydroxyphosphoribosylaminopyrimidine deaminase/5-amino-6-(5-phosphoribosylamino)uracil reductase RibD, partial [SAR202 cluster bacterium]|nr:bifunctional diaminohydroxyphosphoribosylaminopyrimidine deaminase/5-amino-6-(5-phosphoribosylamino)uracil reductase RibD [SAR202 cluster bacterium]